MRSDNPHCPRHSPRRSRGGQRDLSQIPIEDLMNIQVTSVSKKEQKMSPAAAAIFVITQDDIRRSGATNIPELLRLVPGVDVAQINANNWAVSARGFNGVFEQAAGAGRWPRDLHPALGGVKWDTQDVPLEDIDRIEVIRGPGATHVGGQRRQRCDQYRHQEGRGYSGRSDHRRRRHARVKRMARRDMGEPLGRHELPRFCEVSQLGFLAKRRAAEPR